MVYNFSDSRRNLLRKYRQKIMFTVLISFLLGGGALGQTTLSREQFSRLSVRTRAAYFEDEIRQIADSEKVDPNVLWTIAYNETRFRPWLQSPKNAQGLMQFIPATATRFGLNNPFNSSEAIRAAARYVKVLSNLFGGRIDSILAAYNSGEGTVSAYLTGRTLRDGKKIINPKKLKTIGGIPPYTETIGYVGRGLKIYAWLVRRGTFPVNYVRANFPTLISAAIARVRVSDPELGKMPDFNELSGIAQSSSATGSETKNELIEPLDPPNNQQKAAVEDQTEIYYEPRTGSRYLITKGNKTKLNENGIVIIDDHNRPLTTNKARSTFFAVRESN